ncbi:MAG: tetratricopeptide repeat protein [Pseudomonadota bacterium]
MKSLSRKLNGFVAAFCLWMGSTFGAMADETRVDSLLEQLAAPDQTDWEAIEAEIWKEWSRSGSDAMDVLLDRGRAAMEEGDWEAAIEHLTALTDHAPGFAEGWNARATAYFNAGLLGPSMEDIERALILNPRHFGAMSGMATILAELGYEQEALEMYRNALAIHPHSPDLKQSADLLDSKVDGTEL